jgi:hypothetical protein
MAPKIEGYFVQAEGECEEDSKADVGGEMKWTGAAQAKRPREAGVHSTKGMDSDMAYIAKGFDDVMTCIHPDRLGSQGRR